ncbi:MAG TPA: trimethylamine methyltransferase family protein, partial [Nordella sp.]|nr:trimethylamine methyltransferase family protein [Nordella sp.]
MNEHPIPETSIETTGHHRRRREGRRGGEAGQQARGIAQLPRRQVERRFPAMEIVSADEVEAIHQASLTVLEEIGMDFTLPEARDLLLKAGARIEGERVRFDRAMV